MYTLPNIIRVIKSRRITFGEIRNVYKILDEKPKVKTPLVKSKFRWDDNTEMGLKEIVSEGICWIHLAQNRD